MLEAWAHDEGCVLELSRVLKKRLVVWKWGFRDP